MSGKVRPIFVRWRYRLQAREKSLSEATKIQGSWVDGTARLAKSRRSVLTHSEDAVSLFNAAARRPEGRNTFCPVPP